MARGKSARQIAAAKRNLAKARAAKRKFHKNNRKKIQKKRGVVEYKNTGLATTTKSRTFRGAMRKARKASKMNKRYEKKRRKHVKRIAKYSR